jgi:hypothetical protein
MPGITGQKRAKKGSISKNWGELEQALCFFEARTKPQRGKCAQKHAIQCPPITPKISKQVFLREGRNRVCVRTSKKASL